MIVSNDAFKLRVNSAYVVPTCFKRHCHLQGGPKGNAQSSWLLASLSQLKLNCFTLPRKSSVIPARARPALRLRPAHAQEQRRMSEQHACT